MVNEFVAFFILLLVLMLTRTSFLFVKLSYFEINQQDARCGGRSLRYQCPLRTIGVSIHRVPRGLLVLRRGQDQPIRKPNIAANEKKAAG